MDLNSSNIAMKTILCCVLLTLSSRCVLSQSRHNSYASILKDSRFEPTPDGTFRYTYQTEDGIVSSARGDPSGKIQGTFSYTDPTGLRVNINYNAGSRYDNRKKAQAAEPTAQRYYKNAPVASYRTNVPQEYEDDGQYHREYAEDPYLEQAPEPQYQPRARPSYKIRPAYDSRPSYEPRESSYQSRRGRPVPRPNELYDDSYYRS